MDFSSDAAADVVTQAVIVELIAAEGSSYLEADLQYDPRDPCAVTIKFGSAQTEVSWTFARELLLSGLYEPTGDGDVHIRPHLDTEGRAVVIIEFHAPGGQALVQAHSRDIQLFVDRMTTAVEPGTEGQHMNVDHTIAAILVANAGE